MHHVITNGEVQTVRTRGLTSNQRKMLVGSTVFGVLALIVGSALVGSNVPTDIKELGLALVSVGGAITFIFLCCVARHQWNKRKSLNELEEKDDSRKDLFKPARPPSPQLAKTGDEVREEDDTRKDLFQPKEIDLPSEAAARTAMFAKENNHSRYYKDSMNTVVEHSYNPKTNKLTTLEDAIDLTPAHRREILQQVSYDPSNDDWGDSKVVLWKGRHLLVTCEGTILAISQQDYKAATSTEQ